jgi:predicted protein tyrosine phosphatase
MRLLVAPARHVPALLAIHEVDLVVSLISPDAEPPERQLSGPPGLVLRFNDIAEPRGGLVLPSRENMETILGLGERGRTILIHCHAGISRSTAAVYALACQQAGPGHEIDLAMSLRALSAAATPNPRMIALADDLLGREGKMISAIRAIGRGEEAYEGATIDWKF